MTITRVRLNNPAMLKWAREELGLTIPHVAVRFKRIEAWEKGDEAPTFRQLVELANYYKRPVAALFLPSVPPATPKPRDYRTLPGVTPGKYSKETLLAYREVYNMVAETRELLDALEFKLAFSLPAWTMKDNPEEKAQELRSLLGISVEKQVKEFESYNIAEDTWRSALFDKGVIVRICRMPIIEARAFCLFAKDLAGIGLSNEDREHGRIFSLFHEVCHLSLQQPGVSGIASNNKSPHQPLEQYCDRFSASFLLPSSHAEVLESVQMFKGSMDCLEVAQHIAKKFKVSKYVAFRRAFDLDVVSPQDYWRTILEWKRIDAEYARKQKGKASGGNYYATQFNYMGRRFLSLVMQALQKDHLSPIEVRRLVGVDASAVELNL